MTQEPSGATERAKSAAIESVVRPIASMGPVWTKFYQLPISERERLDQAFAIKIPGIQFQPRMRRLIKSGKFDGKHHFFDAENYTIATGLVPKVAPLLPGLVYDDRRFTGSETTWAAARQAVESLELVGIRLRERQRGAARAACHYGRGIIEAATNAGKTEIGAAIAKAFQLPTLWIIPAYSDLLRQTATRLEERLGMPVGRLGDGSRSMGPMVTVAMSSSIKANSKAAKQWLQQFKVLIVDEAHCLAAPTQQAIALNCPAPFRFGMSGSFPDDGIKLMKIMGATDSTLLYRITNQEMIAEGLSAAPVVHVHDVAYDDYDKILDEEIPDGPDEEEEPNDDEEAPPEDVHLRRYKATIEAMVVFNEAYNQIVAKITADWYQKGLSALVLVDRMDQGHMLAGMLDVLNVPHEFLNGELRTNYRSTKLREFKSGKLPVLIATNILNTGIDVARVQVLVLAAAGASPIRLLQRVGRALRSKVGIGENVAHLVDFRHIGCKYLKKQAAKRLKILANQGFEIRHDEKFDLRTK